MPGQKQWGRAGRSSGDGLDARPYESTLVTVFQNICIENLNCIILSRSRY